MSYEDAEKLLEKYIEGIEGIINHSVAVSDFVYELALKFNDKNDVKVDAEKLRIAGLLHDIGKLQKDLPHPLSGERILKSEGFGEIAKIIRTHTIAKEEAESCGVEGDFEPRNFEEELLTYADVHVKGSEVVSFKERFDDVIERSKDDEKRKKNLILGRERISKIVEKIDGILGIPKCL